MSPFRAKDLAGTETQVTYATTRQTLLYVFTPQCGWCTKNLANLLALQHHVGTDYVLIGISLSREGLLEYVAQHGLTFPIYADLKPETVARYHFGSTPQTILISPRGKVIKVWSGAYDGNTIHELENHLSLRLPGPVL